MEIERRYPDLGILDGEPCEISYFDGNINCWCFILDSNINRNNTIKYYYTDKIYRYLLPVRDHSKTVVYAPRAFGIYKNCLFHIGGFVDHKLCIQPETNDAIRAIGNDPGTSNWDMGGYAMVFPEELSDIWVEREHVADFRFDLTSTDFFRVDGEWLDIPDGIVRLY